MARPRVYGPSRTMLSVRLDDDLVEAIDDIADRANMSRSALVTAMLSYCVDAIQEGEIDITVAEPTVDVVPGKRPKRRL